MIRRPPRSTRTDTLFPYTTLFRSHRFVISFLCRVSAGSRGNEHPFAPAFQQTPLAPAIYPGKFSTGEPWKTNPVPGTGLRSEEHTSELQSLMRISYAVFCLKKKTNNNQQTK